MAIEDRRHSGVRIADTAGNLPDGRIASPETQRPQIQREPTPRMFGVQHRGELGHSRSPANRFVTLRANKREHRHSRRANHRVVRDHAWLSADLEKRPPSRYQGSMSSAWLGVVTPVTIALGAMGLRALASLAREGRLFVIGLLALRGTQPDQRPRHPAGAFGVSESDSRAVTATASFAASGDCFQNTVKIGRVLVTKYRHVTERRDPRQLGGFEVAHMVMVMTMGYADNLIGRAPHSAT